LDLGARLGRGWKGTFVHFWNGNDWADDEMRWKKEREELHVWREAHAVIGRAELLYPVPVEA